MIVSSTGLNTFASLVETTIAYVTSLIARNSRVYKRSGTLASGKRHFGLSQLMGLKILLNDSAKRIACMPFAAPYDFLSYRKIILVVSEIDTLKC